MVALLSWVGSLVQPLPKKAKQANAAKARVYLGRRASLDGEAQFGARENIGIMDTGPKKPEPVHPASYTDTRQAQRTFWLIV